MTGFGRNRRGFMTAILAAALVPRVTWADVGSPSYLSAAARADGRYVLCAIDAHLDVLFEIPLPGRGHAAAAHPSKPQAVAFARRPGTFAVVIDCLTGASIATLTAPKGRHFYGHGAFSKTGEYLYTTENDYEGGTGRIGVWDVAAGYQRVAEFSSGGIGPHDIKRLPGSDVLVVANGGIDTHPDSGRTKLNTPTMRPNLTYIVNGKPAEIAELPQVMHKSSIRHLAVSATGQVGFGMQWQGDVTPIGLVGTHQRGQQCLVLAAPRNQVRAMQGYIGSIAFSADNKTLAVTSPRAGLVQEFNVSVDKLKAVHQIEDASGLAMCGDGFVVTSGLGTVQIIADLGNSRDFKAQYAWDNHLVAV